MARVSMKLPHQGGTSVAVYYFLPELRALVTIWRESSALPGHLGLLQSLDAQAGMCLTNYSMCFYFCNKLGVQGPAHYHLPD